MANVIQFVVSQLPGFVTGGALATILTFWLTMRSQNFERRKARHEAHFPKLEALHKQLAEIEPYNIGETLKVKKLQNEGDMEPRCDAFIEFFHNICTF